MIVKCPDCGQELTDTTITCPMCGCRALEKRKSETKKSFHTTSLTVKDLIFRGKYSPIYLFFNWKGGINRAQFFVSLIGLLLIFYLLHVIRREFQLEIQVKPYYLTTAIILLFFDLCVLWKRLYSVAWRRIIVFPLLLLLLVAVYTRIEILSEVSLLIFLLLHAVLFATPEQPDKEH